MVPFRGLGGPSRCEGATPGIEENVWLVPERPGRSRYLRPTHLGRPAISPGQTITSSRRRDPPQGNGLYCSQLSVDHNLITISTPKRIARIPTSDCEMFPRQRKQWIWASSTPPKFLAKGQFDGPGTPRVAVPAHRLANDYHVPSAMDSASGSERSQNLRFFPGGSPFSSANRRRATLSCHARSLRGCFGLARHPASAPENLGDSFRRASASKHARRGLSGYRALRH